MAVVNWLLFFSIQYFTQSSASTVTDEQLREKNQYLALVGSTGDQTLRTVAAKSKLWDMQTARDGFLSMRFEQIPYRRDSIRKAMYLRSKDDLIWAEQVLANTTHEDPIIRSLVLWVRAYFFCEQKLRLECETLAQDSSVLDPLSPLGLLLQGITNSAQNNFTQAKDFFERVEKLDGDCSEGSCLYHRWRTAFYASQYEKAIEDLSFLLWDDDYDYEVRIVLWRISLNQKDFEKAKERFISAREVKWWEDWAVELRLARVALASNDVSQAMNLYRGAYLSGGYGIELITDYLKIAYLSENTWVVQELLPLLSDMVKDQPRNYLVSAKVLREVGEIEMAKDFLERWYDFVVSWEDERQRAVYETDFRWEKHHQLVQQVYSSLVSWSTLSLSWDVTGSWTILLTWDQLRATLFSDLDSLGVNEKQVAFLRWLSAVIASWADTTGSWFQLLPEISGIDIPLIRVWYVLLRGDATRALQILTQMHEFKSDDAKMLWLKWAVTMRLSQNKLSERYLNQLIQSSNLTGDLSLPSLRKESFRSFTPWIWRMTPYFSIDRWWIDTWTREE